MSLKLSFKKQGIYLIIVLVMSLAFYAICDYLLHSVAKELMNYWVATESIYVQEGNLLTSVTKVQRTLNNSSYIKSLKLVNVENNKVYSEFEAGERYDLEPSVFSNISKGINQFRIGFLQERVIYKIPSKENMYLVFDVYSNALLLLFVVSTGAVVFLVLYLILSIQKIEKDEYRKREDLFKLAINELLTNGEASKVLENEMPSLLRWWTLKKNELTESKKIAAEQQGKVLLGEMAAKAVHDIRGSLRNIKEVIKRAEDLPSNQKSTVLNAAEKISKISQDMLATTKQIHNDGEELKQKVNLISFLNSVVESKNTDFNSIATINLTINSQSDLYVYIDPENFRRSLENLIDNAVEASEVNSQVQLYAYAEDKNVVLQVVDSGKGISESDLQKLGSKGFTSGKDNGNGLGVYYAKRFIEENGGRFHIISSIGKGTTIEIRLPLTDSPLATDKSIVAESGDKHLLKLDKNELLLILEDQKLNQHMIRSVLEDAGLDKSKYLMFSNPTDLETWILSNAKKQFKLYSDYYLETASGEKLENGLQFISRMGLVSKSILFTSAYDDQKILDEAKFLGVRVISKDDFFDLRIS